MRVKNPKKAIDVKTTAERIIERIKKNTVIKGYYLRLAGDEGMDGFWGKAKRISECCSMWETETYRKQKVKVLKRTNLCRDKWCENCKRMLAGWRKDKWSPIIKGFDGTVVHMVLTAPNAKTGELKDEIKRVIQSYRTLARHLRGERQIAGVKNPLLTLDVAGSVRAIEVTHGINGYHVHVHAMVGIKGEIGEKALENAYSNSKKTNKKRKFSDTEVYIQKLWYLIHNGLTCNKSNFEQVETGYSCILDHADDDGIDELCKYTTKGTSSNGTEFSYETFKELYYALHGVRVIQGYGCWFNLPNEDEADLDETTEVEEIKEIEGVDVAERGIESIYEIAKLEGWRVMTKAKYYAEFFKEDKEVIKNE